MTRPIDTGRNITRHTIEEIARRVAAEYSHTEPSPDVDPDFGFVPVPVWASIGRVFAMIPFGKQNTPSNRIIPELQTVFKLDKLQQNPVDIGAQARGHQTYIYDNCAGSLTMPLGFRMGAYPVDQYTLKTQQLFTLPSLTEYINNNITKQAMSGYNQNYYGGNAVSVWALYDNNTKLWSSNGFTSTYFLLGQDNDNKGAEEFTKGNWKTNVLKQHIYVNNTTALPNYNWSTDLFWADMDLTTAELKSAYGL